MGDEINILDPQPKIFKVGGKTYEIMELSLRKAGRLITRIISIIQKVQKVRPGLDLNSDNLKDVLGLAEEDIYDALTCDVLGLKGEEREWFLDNCPATIALEMISELLDKNEKLIANFRGLADKLNPK